MVSGFTKASLVVVIFSFAASASAEAAGKRKGIRAQSRAATSIPARYKDDSLFPKGPIYFGGVYLGDDPDPFIRSQILRDAAAKFGGSE